MAASLCKGAVASVDAARTDSHSESRSDLILGGWILAMAAWLAQWLSWSSLWQLWLAVLHV